MRFLRPAAILAILFPLLLDGQVRVVKPVTKSKARNTRLALGTGVTRSVIFLSRNTKANNDAYGINVNLSYGLSRMVRINAEYTNYRPINIAPTWYRINAHTIEVNAQFISKFQDSRTFFYPLFGVSYNVFSGYFTGLNDFMNLRTIYEVNQEVKTRWVGVNAGVGLEQFFPPFSIFGEAKMRVGINEDTHDLTIMDVCYSAGVRINIRARSLYGIFGGTRSRYVLDTKDPDW
jgi:hypothetical protein